MQINLSEPHQNSPIICSLNGHNLTINQSIELRNKLNKIINQHQQHFLNKHISNAGKIGNKQ